MYIDIPSDKLIPELTKGIKEKIKHVMVPELGYIEIEKIEWTKKGIRVWIHTKK